MRRGVIAFRVDSGLEIGSGHLMRCLTVATALREHGWECVFVCRLHQGNQFETIEEYGFQVLPLALKHEYDSSISGYESWLGADWKTDAVETTIALSSLEVHWLVVDHYGIDSRWEGVVGRNCPQILVIDDLANRAHHCNVLLDSSFLRDEHAYRELVPANCIILAGTHYCLLRPEFRKYRLENKKRRFDGVMDTVLVSMGGVDKDNVTTDVLVELNQYRTEKPLSINVIMGAAAPHVDTVQLVADVSRHDVRVLKDVRNMGELMSQSDMCIGAMGSSVWERCCLGLPSLVAVLAENQKEGAEKLAKAGIVMPFSPKCRGSLLARIERMDSSARENLSMKGMRLVDGLGLQRLLDAILETE